ncbi:MAG: zf-HC2 domain-containing protein [Oscillospiraceae bacterium]|nr:zf-HC2 domain-containing protein [Oscillospiraceae bacterium]
MNCEQAMELMSAMLDDALSAEQAQALQAHLEHCPECQRLMQTLSGLDRQLSELQEPVPAAFKDDVLARIHRASETKMPPKRRWFGPGRSVGIVAAILVLLVGTGVIRTSLKGQTEGIYATPDRNMAPALNANQDTLHYGLSDHAELSVSGLENACEGAESVEGLSDEKAEEQEPVEDALIDSSEAEPSVPSPMDETLRAACAKLCGDEDALVLVYTEFDYESYTELLEREAPELYELLVGAEPTQWDGLLCCRTDCSTVFALHEWLIAALSEGETGSRMESSALAISMNALDPDSSSLHRVIRWRAGTKSILWPGQWPEHWVERMMQEENWAMFFPDEDYTPAPEKPAYLVFRGA